MVTLAEALLVLYPSAVPITDYVVGDRGDGSGQRLTAWNAVKLGKQPSAAQVAAVTQQQVADYHGQQAALGAATFLAQVDAMPVAIRAGLIVLGQRLNELLQAYNADRQTRGLAALTPAGDVTKIPTTPLTVSVVKSDAAAVLAKTTWAT